MRIAVVGAGLGGLAVAMRLAAKRHEVTVFERGSRVGGKLHTHRDDEFAWDTGPSLLTLPAVLRDLFLKTGRALEDEVDLQELEPGFRYQFPDQSTLALPGAGPGRTTTAIRRQFGDRAADGWQKLNERAAQIWRLTHQPVLTAEPSAAVLRELTRGKGNLRTVAPWRSLDKFAAELPDPRLGQVLQRYATYSGSLPKNAPGSLITIPYVEQAFGLWHIGGGLGQLSGIIEQRCRKLGVTFRMNEAVTQVHTNETGIEAVQTEVGSQPFDLVVSDMDAQRLYALVADKRAQQELNRLQKRTRSYSGFALLLGVSAEFAELHHHNVWFPKDYDQEFADLKRGRPPQDPTIYVCRPSDPQMAPDGAESWFLLVNAPRHGTGKNEFDWSRAASDEYADHLLSVLAQRGMDVRPHVDRRIVQSPADLGQTDGTVDGAIYGSAQVGALSLLRRPRNTSPVPGLKLVGGTTHPGGGIPLVGMSAELVAEQVGRA